MTRKRTLYVLLSLLFAVIVGAALYINSLLPIITGYAAKNLCSDIFISGRKQAEVEKTDLNFSFIKFTRNKVDTISKSVVSHFLWGSSKAIFRDGFGTTLLRGVDESDLRKIKYPEGTEPGYSRDTIPWPMGDIVADTVGGIDRWKCVCIHGCVQGGPGCGSI